MKVGISIVNRSSLAASGIHGLVYSTRNDRPVVGCSWRFWYLQRSKKVWFRISCPPSAHTTDSGLLFRYNGRAILHCSERADWINRWGCRPRPVVWGKYLGIGWGQGPHGTNLFLNLWSRWAWLHPEACGHPERFSVVSLTCQDPQLS